MKADSGPWSSDKAAPMWRMNTLANKKIGQSVVEQVRLHPELGPLRFAAFSGDDVIVYSYRQQQQISLSSAMDFLALPRIFSEMEVLAHLVDDEDDEEIEDAVE